MLAQAAPIISLSLDEQRIAVHRRLHHRSQNQPLLRLRTHAAGDCALVADGQRRAARGDGAVAAAHGGGWFGPAWSRAESGLGRFRAKWIPVRAKKARQKEQREPGSDFIRTGRALIN